MASNPPFDPRDDLARAAATPEGFTRRFVDPKAAAAYASILWRVRAAEARALGGPTGWEAVTTRRHGRELWIGPMSMEVLGMEGDGE